MKYFKDLATGEVYAYESDGSQDEWILPWLVRMTDEEVALHLNPPPTEEQLLAAAVSREGEWRVQELRAIADQLLAIEDDDPAALPGTDRQWRDYRIQVRAWKEDHVDFPDETKRPVRPS